MKENEVKLLEIKIKMTEHENYKSVFDTKVEELNLQISEFETESKSAWDVYRTNVGTIEKRFNMLEKSLSKFLEMENELKSLKADNLSLIKTVNEYVNKENKNGASEKEIPGTVLKGNPMSDDIRSKERELVKKRS